MKKNKQDPKLQKFGIIATGVINYLLSVALSVIFALYLSGRIGWFLVAAFICAPLLSVLLTLIFLPRIYISCDTDSISMCKGDSCELTVNIANRLFLPSPPIRADMITSPSIACEDRLFTVSVMPFSSESFTAKYSARISGPSEIGVGRVRITDYFGFFSFEPKNIDYKSLSFTVSVIPDIAEIKVSDPALRHAEELAAFADDSEDTVENSYGAYGGLAGYDNREYVPGDPLKRINWKQSAKRGKLLVRLDDEVTTTAVSIVLDSVFIRSEVFLPAVASKEEFSECGGDELLPVLAQTAVEHSLGMARALLLRSFTINYFLTGKNGWDNYPVSDENDLSELRTELASYTFSEEKGSDRFPYEELAQQKGSVALYCTPYLDGELASLIPTGDPDGKSSLQVAVFCPAAAPGTEDIISRKEERQ